jgi:hypothetical protein
MATTYFQSQQRQRLKLVILALAASLIAMMSLLAAGPATAATSDQGGPISRSEVMDRADNWLRQASTLRYDGPLYPDGDGHLYRQDCSGFVSMALHSASQPGTAALAGSGLFTRINRSDLLPGDVLNNSINGHAVLFAGYNADHVHFDYYSYGGTPIKKIYSSTWNEISALPGGNYVAWRYNNISGDPAPAPAPAPRQSSTTRVVARTSSTWPTTQRFTSTS